MASGPTARTRPNAPQPTAIGSRSGYCLAPLKTSKRGQAAHAAIRSVCPTMEKDRVMYKDFARLAELIASGKVAEALR